MVLKPLEPGIEPRNWHDKLRVWPLRTPRPGVPELVWQLRDSWPTKVFLREGKKTTSIVLVLPVSGRRLPRKARRAYFRSGLTFERAFDEIVWTTPHTKKRAKSFWAQFAKVAYDAYWETWRHLLTEVYRKHSEPIVDRKLGNWLDDLEGLRRPRRAGRRAETDAERNSLLRRLRELEAWCQRIHNCIKKYNRQKLPRFEIELKASRLIHHHRCDDAILGGYAFRELPNKNASLHDAQTWTPRQLALALLGIERGGLEYAWMARKLGVKKRLG